MPIAPWGTSRPLRVDQDAAANLQAVLDYLTRARCAGNSALSVRPSLDRPHEDVSLWWTKPVRSGTSCSPFHVHAERENFRSQVGRGQERVVTTVFV
jgi:hypothetical protein